MDTATSNNVLVLGAGVIGLTTAMILSRDSKNKITVAAKHMPGDYDIEYTSPWAGANYLPVGLENDKIGRWEKLTWPHLEELAVNCPEAGIHFQDAVIYNRKKDQDSTVGKWFSELSKPNPWYRKVVPNYRELTRDELGEDIDNGNKFTSVCINTAVYLPWLVGQCNKQGVVFKRANVSHIAEAADLHHSGKKADVVVNCTGLSSLHLGGVMDSTLLPARGQIVVVRNDPGLMVTISGTDDGDDEATYMMTRAVGGGTILGGCYQKNNWDPNPDPNLAVRIMKRCIELCPSLVGENQGIEGLSIIRHGVGLRPLREGGPRCEKEKFDDFWVVHNYGHAGYGYQTSYGSAIEAVELVEQALVRRNKSKL